MTKTTQQTEQKVAIVTGVATGFGSVLCASLAQAGYSVVGIARSRRAEQEINKAVTAASGTYRHELCDIGDGNAAANILETIENECGPVEVLIHNAHKLHIKPFAETSPEDFEAVWRTGCFGAMNAAQAVLPKMANRGSGTIIFSGATASKRAGAKFAAFASAKFALRGLAQSLAREYGPQGIHVVHSVIDGLIWEEQTRQRFSPEETACISPQAIAETYMHLIAQHKSAWTHEIDIRPFAENF